MSRPFDFSESVKEQARLRQTLGRESVCAVCGNGLNDLYENAHHVCPNQVGKKQVNAHAWLKMTMNCVVLCDLCHERVHENARFKLGSVAPPEYFEYSHGSNKAAHEEWVKIMTKQIREIYA